MEETRLLAYRSSTKRQVLFQLQEGVLQELDRMANVYKMSRSILIREAIMQLLEQEIPTINKRMKSLGSL